MQKSTFTGNITNVKLATDRNGNIVEPQFLNVTVACEDSKKNSISIVYTDDNGMLKAFQEGRDMTGARVIVHGDIDATGIRTSYVKNGVVTDLKRPELKLKYVYTERVSSAISVASILKTISTLGIEDVVTLTTACTKRAADIKMDAQHMLAEQAHEEEKIEAALSNPEYGEAEVSDEQLFEDLEVEAKKSIKTAKAAK